MRNGRCFTDFTKDSFKEFIAEIPEFAVEYSLYINGEYYNTLDIEGFSQMMKDPSYCYKFYWLETIVDIISEGIQDTTFNAIIDKISLEVFYHGMMLVYLHPPLRL